MHKQLHGTDQCTDKVQIQIKNDLYRICTEFRQDLYLELIQNILSHTICFWVVTAVTVVTKTQSVE